TPRRICAVSAPLFLVQPGSLRAAGTVEVGGAEGRHAVKVRRLRVGEAVDLADGDGVVGRGVVGAATGDVLTVEVRDVERLPEPVPRLVVAQALPKGDRGELAVELMTELGVDAIVPWAASRCVTVWSGERGEKARGRWAVHAREAAKQSRRPRVPAIESLATTKALAARDAAILVLHEEATAPISAVELPATGEVLVVVGPEGGISAEELTAFQEAGARSCRLGPEVLRTSTAGPAALAVLSLRFGRWG
ncbi:MAG TPA: 16S rRNA (uracil(1498)-N(3))-methyltransferase, partial [Sporichthyaceae bacterium]